MAKELLPRFITSQEVDPLLGSTRTRERWERAGLLPPGELVSGYRSAVKVFPDFAVARLAAPQSLERSKTLQRGLAQLARGLYRGEVFNELRAALKEALAPKRAMGVAELVSALLPTHRELLELFAANIRGVEQALRELDVDVTVSLARVVRRERDLYVVELVAGGEREVGSGAASPSHRFESGQWAMLEEARVRGFKREFLLPTAVLDDALAEAAIRASQEPAPGARELLRGALADRPAPIDELTRGREPIDMRDELRAGRVGAINTEPILSPVREAEVSGLTYSEPAFS